MRSIRNCMKSWKARRALALAMALSLSLHTVALAMEDNPWIEAPQPAQAGDQTGYLEGADGNLDGFGGDGAADGSQQAAQAMGGNSGIDMDADLRVGYVAATGNQQINPFLCSERDLVSLNQLVFESVVELDDEFRPKPLLADSWTVEEKTWTFKLRDGIVFHNGAPLTASDVVMSYQTFLSAGETNPYYGRLKLIEGMEVVDALTLRVSAKYSGYVTLYAMTFPVVQQSTINESVARGTGPYWYTQFVYGVGLRLEANPLWWKNDPEIHSVAAVNYADSGDALEALKMRQINLLCTQSDNASFSRRLSEYTSMDYVTNTYEMLVPNLNDSSVMSDVRIRQAVMYAIDRAALASNAYLGMGIQCEVPVNPGSWLYESQSAIYYYSPERALQLLQNCGWKDLTGDGILNQVDGVILKDLELRLVTYNEPTNSIRENACNMIAEQLSKVGIKVKIEVRGKERVLRYVREGSYDIALVGVNLSEVPDLSQMFRSGGNINLNNYGNENMKSLLEQVPAAQSEEALKSLYSQIQMNVVDRLPVLGLLFRTGTVISTRSLAGLSGIRVENTLNGIEFMTKQQ